MRLSFSRTTAILQREGRKEEGGEEGGGWVERWVDLLLKTMFRIFYLFN